MMSKYLLLGCGLWILSSVSASFLLLADESDGKDSARGRQMALVKSYADRHRIVAANDPGRVFKLRPAPLLYWTNPVRGNVSGGIYLWTDDKQPIAYGGIFVWLDESSQNLAREFHSLSEQPLIATFDSQTIWTPMNPGVDYRTIPGAAAVGSFPAIRLRQMKQLANRFAVTISHPTSESDKVRLLPTPLYRYGDAESELLDGAIFAFAQGNDPEALLMIEAHSERRGEQPQWRYGWARCTTWAVDAQLDGKTVYQVPFYDFSRNDRNAAFANIPRITLN